MKAAAYATALLIVVEMLQAIDALKTEGFGAQLWA